MNGSKNFAILKGFTINGSHSIREDQFCHFAASECSSCNGDWIICYDCRNFHNTCFVLINTFNYCISVIELYAVLKPVCFSIQPHFLCSIYSDNGYKKEQHIDRQQYR